MSAFLPIVIAELELGNIERQVFFADLVESANNAALHDGPKAFDGVGVDRADDMFASLVANEAMIEAIADAPIARVLVGAEQLTRVETVSLTNFSHVSVSTCSTTRAITLPFRFTAPMTENLCGSAWPPPLWLFLSQWRL